VVANLNFLREKDASKKQGGVAVEKLEGRGPMFFHRQDPQNSFQASF
jgi:hypothetical protein